MLPLGPMRSLRQRWISMLLPRKMSVSLPNELPIDDTYVGGHRTGDDLDASTSRSLASTVKSYQFENGRRYHSYREGAYWGPNDEADRYHQLIAHHLCCLLQEDKLILAPVSDPHRALDIGTGIGLWAIDFADQYPNATVIGTDLSPEWEPISQPNLHFEVDDCCSEWTYPKEYFDYIHIRGLYGSIEDWEAFYQQCYTHLTPGGYIEQAEFGVKALCDDNSMQPGSVFDRWYRLCEEAGRNMGKDITVADKLKDSITAAGFVDVVEHRFKVPVGPWSSDPRMKEVGRWYRDFMDTGMEGWWMAVGTRYLGWTIDDVHAFLSETKTTLRDRRVHIYFEIAVVHGRKPER